MTNQDAMRLKYFLEKLVGFHGGTRAEDGETVCSDAHRVALRSDALAVFAESALDHLGEIDWPDEKIKVS